jgi:hypothetical protein
MANVRLTHPEANGSISVREDMVANYEGQGWVRRTTSDVSPPRKQAAKKTAARKTAAKKAAAPPA